MRRGSSLRLSGWPTVPGILASLHLLRSVLDRGDNVLIPGTAAEIARDPVPDLGFGWLGIMREQRAGREHHARRAESALQPVLFPESLLHGMQPSGWRHALD